MRIRFHLTPALWMLPAFIDNLQTVAIGAQHVGCLVARVVVQTRAPGASGSAVPELIRKNWSTPLRSSSIARMPMRKCGSMVTLIEAFEAKHYPIDPPDPVDAIKFRIAQQGLKPKDLEPMIGQRNRVYEVLNGKRKVTLAMVRKLHTGLGIPAESLIRQPG